MHWFPMAAMAVGGDPMDLHVERFNELCENIVDIESWKWGESEEKRRDRKMLDFFDGPMLRDEND